MKYLIACDLDGTLLTKNSELSQTTIEIINQLASKGHYIVLTTGRPYCGAIDFYRQLQLDTILITDNGSLLTNPKNDTFVPVKKSINLNVMYDWFNDTKQLLESALYTDFDNSYAYKYSKDLEYIFNGVVNPNIIERDFNLNDVAPSLIICAIKDYNYQPFEELTSKYYNHLSIRFWGSNGVISFVEVHLKNISKASALQEALDYYGLKQDNLIAIGDGINDKEMLEYAKIGIKMKDSHPVLSEVADLTTDFDHEYHGAALFLNKIINQK